MRLLFLLLWLSAGLIHPASCIAEPPVGPSQKVLPSDSLPKTLLHHGIFIIPEFQLLRSTHKNCFGGGSVTLSKFMSSRFAIGVGVEYSHSNLHMDNGWILTRLQFLPVFADFKYVLTRNTLIQPYLEIAPGASFIQYYKRDEYIPQTPYRLRAIGLYLYGGGGVILNVAKNFSPIIGIGFKGFHMSTNSYEVNPHGLTFRVGFMF